MRLLFNLDTLEYKAERNEYEFYLLIVCREKGFSQARFLLQTYKSMTDDDLVVFCLSPCSSHTVFD